MRKFLCGMAVWAPCWLMAMASAGKSVTVHVTSSRLMPICGSQALSSTYCDFYLHLTTVIDGKTVELDGKVKTKYLLKREDYQAILSEDKSTHDYESHQEYEFQFPDGDKKKFVVVAESE